MNTFQYFSRKIKALAADKQENQQAPLFEELSDSETSKIVGGASFQRSISISEEDGTDGTYVTIDNAPTSIFSTRVRASLFKEVR